jgi:hypothetical protein
MPHSPLPQTLRETSRQGQDLREQEEALVRRLGQVCSLGHAAQAPEEAQEVLRRLENLDPVEAQDSHHLQLLLALPQSPQGKEGSSGFVPEQVRSFYHNRTRYHHPQQGLQEVLQDGWREDVQGGLRRMLCVSLQRGVQTHARADVPRALQRHDCSQVHQHVQEQALVQSQVRDHARCWQIGQCVQG